MCVGVFSFHWVGRPDSVQGRTRKVGGAGAVSAAVTAMQINAGPRNPTRNITVLLESRKSASDNIVQYTKVFFFSSPNPLSSSTRIAKTKQSTLAYSVSNRF